MSCDLKNSKVVLVVAHTGNQPIEYAIPKKFLEEQGIQVITASNRMGMALAKDGSSTPVDITIDKLHLPDYAGIFFIGGPGAQEHLDNGQSYKLLHEAKRLNIPYGAICWSTRILAKAG